MKKVTLKKVGVMSIAKVGGVFYGIIGIIIAVVMTLIGLLGIAMGGSDAATSGIITIVGGFVMAIAYAIIGAIAAAISAFIFNVVTGFAGGIEFEVE